MTLANAGHYLALVFTPTNLFWITLASLIGAFLGALPGMSQDTGIPMFLPLTFNMEPLTGLLVLCAIYTSASYGGNITGVLLNTPGTPEAMYMAMDGYPMTVKGQGKKALYITTCCAFIGGITGALTLLFLAPVIASFALKFGPLEMFLTALLGITIIVGLSKGGMMKGGMSACLGLLCGLIGMDPFNTVPRFTFGLHELYDGLPLLPTVLGLFAVSQLLVMAAQNNECVVPDSVGTGKSEGLTRADAKEISWVTIRSSIIGTIVGIIPAASTAVAVGLSYGITKREDPHPEEYGNGSKRGLASCSAAHAAITGGSLVPLLTLCIPGNATAALFLAGLTIHGLAPGVKLFTTDASVVYPMMIGLVIAQFFILIVGLLGGDFFCRITKVPTSILIPIVGCFSVLGSFIFRYLNFDIFLVLLCGVIGYYMNETNLPPAPFVLAFVLGSRCENTWRRVVALAGARGFWSLALKPIPIVLFCINMAFLIMPFWAEIKGIFRKQPNKDA